MALHWARSPPQTASCHQGARANGRAPGRGHLGAGVGPGADLMGIARVRPSAAAPPRETLNCREPLIGARARARAQKCVSTVRREERTGESRTARDS